MHDVSLDVTKFVVANSDREVALHDKEPSNQEMNKASFVLKIEYVNEGMNITIVKTRVPVVVE